MLPKTPAADPNPIKSMATPATTVESVIVKIKQETAHNVDAITMIRPAPNRSNITPNGN